MQWSQIFSWTRGIQPLLDAYKITESPSQEILSLESLTNPTRTLFIPSNSMKSNSIYAFSVSLTVYVNNFTTVFTSYAIISVIASPLVARIAGSNRLTSTAFSKNIQLNATSSFDPDNVVSSFKYNWSCKITSNSSLTCPFSLGNDSNAIVPLPLLSKNTTIEVLLSLESSDGRSSVSDPVYCFR